MVVGQSLSLMPDDALVGLITFGQMCHVHELGFTACSRSFVFRGGKVHDPDAIRDMLGIKSSAASGGPGASGPAAAAAGATSGIGAAAGGGAGGGPAPGTLAKGAERYLRPVSECSLHLESILEALAKDPWPHKDDERPARCTGTALSIAVTLLAKAIGWRGARIMLFSGGPPTQGPGAVIEQDLRITMRSHEDIQKGREAAKHVEGASTFYDDLAKQCVANGHIVDVFACALDQVGLLEMRSLVIGTGGLAVLADSFGQSVFKESYRRVFARHEDGAPPCDAGHLTMAFAATLEVQTSPEFKVCGAVGPCTSLKKTSASVSKHEVGEGGSYAWAMGGIRPSTTVALYFDLVQEDAKPIPPTKRRYLQLVTRYQHSSGRFRMRVTTAPGVWCPDPSSKASLVASFDQEAAAVLVSRIAVDRTRTEEPGDILRWLDRSLIRMCSQFAEYTPDNAASFTLGSTLSMFPQFLFHLRRSQFVLPGTYSPDETVYYRATINSEDVANSLVMIQPSLIQYSFAGPPTPVLLDATSVRTDVILLLDSFFTVVVWHGSTIALWRDEGYQHRPEHTAFKNLLQAPLDDAQHIMADRFPVPRYIICDQDKSQARFLMAKVNPSVTHTSSDAAGTAVLTDEVSFSVFMDALIKLAVQP